MVQNKKNHASTVAILLSFKVMSTTLKRWKSEAVRLIVLYQLAIELFHRSSGFKQAPSNKILFTLKAIFGDFEINLEYFNGRAYLSKVF